MKKSVVQRPVFSALPALVLCSSLLFPCVMPTGVFAAESGDALYLAADEGSSLPVIPRVPERSRRAPQRTPGSAPQAAEAAAPATPPSASPSPVVTTPAPVTPPAIAAPPSAPAPRVAAPSLAPPPRAPAQLEPTAPAAPAPVVETPLEEPIAPPVVATPEPAPKREAPAPAPRTRTKRYDPKLVLDPSPAEPYVTREIYIDGPPPGDAGYRADRPVWMTDVPIPGSGPARIPVPAGSAPHPMGMYGAGTMIPGGGVPLYSTQPVGVSNPLPFEPITYVTPLYGPPVGSAPGGRGGHGGYPGAIGSPWPSDTAQIYTTVPPERVSGNIGSERPRDSYSQPPFLPEDHRISRDTPSLPADRIMPRNELEPDPDRVRPLRPRR